MWNKLLPCVSLIGFALPAAGPADDLRISGPFTHDNLSIFLIHSARPAPGAKLLTLREAMEQKKVVLYETGSVNELAIENHSSEDVYIQSGDIVKGGRQDRVIPEDYILTSKSGKVPIQAFCVEHGRWTRRGSEAADRFSGTANAVAGPKLKMAVREKKNQSEVWNEVAMSQGKLQAASVGTGAGAGYRHSEGSVRAFNPPPSGSMQLAIEDKHIVAATDAYTKDLAHIIEGQKDVVGYAFAVNGKVSSADIYASHDLFVRMWSKLLNASAVEALEERPGMKTATPPDTETVRKALADAEAARGASKTAGRVSVVRKESDKTLLFETRDRDEQNAWIHRSYIMR